MAERVLITGVAGFIGSHLADELLRAGYDVRALDVLVEQMRGDATDRFDRAAAELAERGLTR